MAWKKVHVEDANTVHGTITATLDTVATDISANTGEILIVTVGSTGEESLTSVPLTLEAGAFNDLSTFPQYGDFTDGAGIDFTAGSGDVTAVLDISTVTALNAATDVQASDVVIIGDTSNSQATRKTTVSKLVAAVSSGVTSIQFEDDAGVNSGADTGAVVFTITGGTGLTSTIAATGDNEIQISLNDTGVTTGTYGNATNVPVYTVNAQGQLTAANNAAISIPVDLTGDNGSTGQFTASTTGILDFAGTANETVVEVSSNTVTVSLPDDVTIGNNLTVTNDLTVTGDLIVNGDSTTVNTTNLTVEDQFIKVNNNPSAADIDQDSGIVFGGQGAALGWDASVNRLAVDFTGATDGYTTLVDDAYLSCVVTSNDANFEKDGNIKIDSGEIYIWA